MFQVTLAQQISAWILPVLLAITVHETAHGWLASRLGDPTARLQGRLSLNPLRHIDPVGTVLVPALMLLLPGGFVFGWARPVPVDWRRLRNPRRDMGWAIAIRVAQSLDPGHWMARPLLFMGVAGVFINTVLMVVNLLPLPPLDGGRVATGLLPAHLARPLARLEPWGIWILLGLLMTGLLGWLIWPAVSAVLLMLAGLAGLSAQQLQIILMALMRS